MREPSSRWPMRPPESSIGLWNPERPSCMRSSERRPASWSSQGWSTTSGSRSPAETATPCSPRTPTSIASRKSAEPVSGHRSPRTFRKAWGTTHRDKARQVDNVCPEHSGNSPGGLHRKYRTNLLAGFGPGHLAWVKDHRDGHGGYSGSARHPLLHRRGYRRRKLLEPDSHTLAARTTWERIRRPRWSTGIIQNGGVDQ